MEKDWFDFQRWTKKKGYDTDNREELDGISIGKHLR